MKFLKAIWAWFRGNSRREGTYVPPKTPDLPKPVMKYSSLTELPVGSIGVDISHHNKSVDLYKLSKAVDFIYMKATEGATFVSSTYNLRAEQLKTLGCLWGAYHYYRINVDPISQAKHFVKFKSGWSLPPVLDIEAINNDGYNSSKHTADLLDFLRYVEAHTGFVPVVYTSFYYARDVIKPSQEFAKYPLWLAWYTSDFGRVKTPKPWDNIKIWQFTEHGSIEGVTGDVDINRIMS